MAASSSWRGQAPRGLLKWSGPHFSGSFLCLQECLGERLIILPQVHLRLSDLGQPRDEARRVLGLVYPPGSPASAYSLGHIDVVSRL